jgi:TldD protein
VLIQDGVLTDYMWDGIRARKEKHGQTGNGRRQSYKVLPMVRMTNTYLLAGESDPDDIIASTERGVFVKRLGGGQVDTASGDFVFGMVESYLIENGEITEPLRESNLIGNGPDVLRAIDAVASDFAFADGGGMCGKDGQSVPVGMGMPTLRVSAMTVGGTAGE